jgi:hypothetical protein
MSVKLKPISLSAVFNSPAKLCVKPGKELATWHPSAKERRRHLPRGAQTYWGIPFKLGPEEQDKDGLIVLERGIARVEAPLQGKATHICVLHFCDVTDDMAQSTAGGELLAKYELRYADGTTHAVPIRRRFEVNPFATEWGRYPFVAMPAAMPQPMADDATRYGWGYLQTGVDMGDGPFQTWVYAIENPYPNVKLKSVSFKGLTESPVGVLAVTLYNGPGHPLRHVPRKVYRLVVPEPTTPEELDAQIDLGVVTRLYAVPGRVSEEWLEAPDRGLGQPRSSAEPSSEFIIEATGAEGATLAVKAAGERQEVALGEAFGQGSAASKDGKVRIEIVNPRTTWVHVTVNDSGSGKPTPVRVHFRGKHGNYIPPYGHHEQVNDRWFEDYGGDLQMGAQSFAYVPGKFQIELPVGEVYVELTKGFEYAPVRQRLEVAPGQRSLELSIGRWCEPRREGWVTADTHVHFITPQTAALEGKAEGLNLINLLASQWGRLFTNVSDITGEASGCSDEETIVWVGTENRNHLLGHISMLGTHGDPVFPMCAGGPSEAYLGDPDLMSLTEWARSCKEREGVVIRPHFPSPPCEEPVYFMLGELDGAELRYFANPDSGTLDQFHFLEWYRYLNCGARVAAVGGTDKMSAGMPVGGVRTYAQLGADEELSFESWGRAIRAGRTYTTSGPLISLTVDGNPIGSEIRMGESGGEVEVIAEASSVWPVHALEVVVNGAVVAASHDANGTGKLSLRERIPLKGSAWIAARCGSRLQVSHCWPIHLGAHTSPVYVVCGGQQLFSPSDATYMLTLLDGGMTYLDTLSVRYSDDRHQQIKALFEKAKTEISGRMR